MLLTRFCAPAFIYFIFSLIHVLVSIYKGYTSQAVLQFLIGLLMTFLLQLLCFKGMTIVSWIFVFIPFISYTYMMILLFNAFGLQPSETMQQYVVS